MTTYFSYITSSVGLIAYCKSPYSLGYKVKRDRDTYDCFDLFTLMIEVMTGNPGIRNLLY